MIDLESGSACRGAHVHYIETNCPYPYVVTGNIVDIYDVDYIVNGKTFRAEQLFGSGRDAEHELCHEINKRIARLQHFKEVLEK